MLITLIGVFIYFLLCVSGAYILVRTKTGRKSPFTELRSLGCEDAYVVDWAGEPVCFLFVAFFPFVILFYLPFQICKFVILFAIKKGEEHALPRLANDKLGKE